MIGLIALLAIAVIAWRVASTEQRIKILQTIDISLSAAREHGRDDLARFRTARRARVRWAIATSALAALNVVVFLWAPKAQGAATGVLPWGVSYGPLTSNGQWWRLATAIFVNRSFFLLVVNVAVLAQVGLVLERMVGPVVFATAYLAAGLFSGIASLAMYPMAVMAGPAGAIWGLYGMLIIVAVPLWRRRSELSLPLAAIERLAAGAVVFGAANLFDASAGGAAQFVGLSTGVFIGLAPARVVAAGVMPARRAAMAGGIVLAIAMVCALPLRGVLDIRPEIARVVQVEQKTAASFRTMNDQYRKGHMTGDTLADRIEQTIVPELQAASARLDTLRGVPAEDMPRVADAREFLRLRSESWHLRAQSLRQTARSVRSAAKVDGDSDGSFRQRAQEQYQSTLLASGKADGAERASLLALSRLQQTPPAADH